MVTSLTRLLYGRLRVAKIFFVFWQADQLQIYIQPVDADRSLLTLMGSADPHRISPSGLESPDTQVWRVKI